MLIYHLYKKTHNITGLKYLGKSTKNTFKKVHKYPGSGTRWKYHLNKHGKNYITEIVGSYDTLEEFKKWGLYYSNLWNIVESKEWANLVPEDGSGTSLKNRFFSEEHRKNISIAQMGNKYKLGFLCSEETKQKMRKTKKPRTPEHNKNNSEALKKYWKDKKLIILSSQVEQRI